MNFEPDPPVRLSASKSVGARLCLRVCTAALLLIFVRSEPAVAQTSTGAAVPAVFSKLEGAWIGSGRLMGQRAAFLMRWEMGSDGFVRLSFSNASMSDDGSRTPVLTSEATYLPDGASAKGVWIDDRPQRLILDAVLTDSTVVTTWTAEAETGKTEYTVLSPDAVLVRDFVHVDGSERLFGEASYRRAGTDTSR